MNSKKIPDGSKTCDGVDESGNAEDVERGGLNDEKGVGY
jgi:hypothetical protein